LSIVELASPYDFATTLDRLDHELAGRGIEVFARIDHAAAATAAGLAMPPTTVVVFGNARAGTPLMLDAPQLALDLPLRILVRQGPDGVLVAYHEPVALLAEYGLAPERAAALHAVAVIAHTVAGD
jgi:uncharacterized protein (DUF302 family)